MRHQQVFVRAKNKDGKWDTVDVLDLDDLSFRAFIIDRLIANGLVVALVDEQAGDEITLQEKGRVVTW